MISGEAAKEGGAFLSCLATFSEWMVAGSVDGGALLGGDCGDATGDRRAFSWKWRRQLSEESKQSGAKDPSRQGAADELDHLPKVENQEHFSW